MTNTPGEPSYVPRKPDCPLGWCAVCMRNGEPDAPAVTTWLGTAMCRRHVREARDGSSQHTQPQAPDA